MTDILVIGGGAAGILASWRAASLGAKVTLLEKTPRLGAKILVSGGGKCNICHDGPIEDVLRAFRPNEARFLRPSVYRWPNASIIEMLTSRGLEVYTRPDGRIFPVRQTAKEVVGILRSYLVETGVDLRLETPATSIRQNDDGTWSVGIGEKPLPYLRNEDEGGAGEGVGAIGLRTQPPSHSTSLRKERALAAKRLILSVGGSSYPKIGTTGDGYPWVKQFGHTLVPIRAALAPIYLDTDESWADLSGNSLRDVVVKARLDGKEIDRFRGDLLFTHQGVSGPCALAVSRAIAERGAEGSATIEADLAPDKSFEAVSEELLVQSQANPKRQIDSLLHPILVEALRVRFFQDLAIDPSQPMSHLDKKSRNRMVEAIKGWRLGTVRAIPLEKGECVAGGVALDEVDPHTMRSLRAEGLYLCGEILDIAGPVGGYNLQAAFATGYVAGESAAKSLK